MLLEGVDGRRARRGVGRRRWPASSSASARCRPRASRRSEVDRYLGLPGQAISYKVGEREWLAAREDARAAAGADFDLKAWHMKALALGSVGLAVLRAELASA